MECHKVAYASFFRKDSQVAPQLDNKPKIQNQKIPIN